MLPETCRKPLARLGIGGVASLCCWSDGVAAITTTEKHAESGAATRLAGWLAANLPDSARGLSETIGMKFASLRTISRFES